ncbi:lysozyme inhibitor LprI family protein [Inquilinus limosus]|uniref:lysozyme inhibitor LprI family protein n=1 Tax=Inquilinus limosus TaxID=171674 RepID=UPI00041B0C1F|nr:lysozyme inhibitor LprI family protein [Inquilinus limosus]
MVKATVAALGLCLAVLHPAAAVEAPSLDAQVIAARTGPQKDVALVLMVTGDGLDPSALPFDAESCDGGGYARTDDPQEIGCYKFAVTENGKPVSELSYDHLFTRGTTAALVLRYHTPVESSFARTLRLDISFKLGDAVVRSRHPEAEIAVEGIPGDAFADPENPWAPLYAFQDRRLNAIYDGLISSPKVADDTELRRLIVKAERDWIAFKEDDCAAPLTASPVDADQCRTMHTVVRIDQLTELKRSLAEAKP